MSNKRMNGLYDLPLAQQLPVVTPVERTQEQPGTHPLSPAGLYSLWPQEYDDVPVAVISAFAEAVVAAAKAEQAETDRALADGVIVTMEQWPAASEQIGEQYAAMREGALQVAAVLRGEATSDD